MWYSRNNKGDDSVAPPDSLEMCDLAVHPLAFLGAVRRTNHNQIAGIFQFRTQTLFHVANAHVALIPEDWADVGRYPVSQLFAND